MKYEIYNYDSELLVEVTADYYIHNSGIVKFIVFSESKRINTLKEKELVAMISLNKAWFKVVKDDML